MKLCCLERLAILVSKALVFCPGLDLSGGYGDLVYLMLCNTLVLWGWSVINPGVSLAGTSNSTILPQGYRTGPRHDFAGIALHPTSFLRPSRRWGKGEAIDIVARSKRRGLSP